MKINALTTKEIRELIREGKWKNLDFYIICYRPSEDLKFAFSATREAKTKVLRNRIKRILREAIRTSSLSTNRGRFLIIGKPPLLTLKFRDLQFQLKKDLENLAELEF